MADSESDPKGPGSIELIESTENAEKVTALKASNLVSPPGSKTPPVPTSKRNSLRPNQSSDKNPKRSESVNPDALSKALKEFEEAGRQRERTPGTSPSRKRQRVYGDRLVLNCPLDVILRIHLFLTRIACSHPLIYSIVAVVSVDQFCAGLSRIAKGKISRPASACYMKADAQLLRRNLKRGPLRGNSISKSVCYTPPHRSH